jgi:hypothetical protein
MGEDDPRHDPEAAITAIKAVHAAAGTVIDKVPRAALLADPLEQIARVRGGERHCLCLAC